MILTVITMILSMMRLIWIMGRIMITEMMKMKW